MTGLSTTIAAYPDLATAEKDWTSVESAASSRFYTEPDILPAPTAGSHRPIL